MLESDIILGISANLEGCSQYAHGILTQEWEGWPVGTPLVFPDSGLENSHGSVRTLSLMTPAQHSAGRESSNVPTSLICPVDLRPLCGNHKVINVSEFDLGKFDRLTEFIRDVGGISLVIEYPAGRKAIPKQMRKIEKLFEYSSMFYYNGWGSKHLLGEDDKFIGVMTFLDLPYCIPIFNMRRVHGLGLSFSGATLKASKSYGQLHRIFRTDFIYSNYIDNAFVIDGIDVNTVRPMSTDVYKELVKMISQELSVVPEGEAKKKGSRIHEIKREMREQSSHREEMKYGYGGADAYNNYKMKSAKANEVVEVDDSTIEWHGPNDTVELDTNESLLVTDFPSLEAEVEPSDEPVEHGTVEMSTITTHSDMTGQIYYTTGNGPGWVTSEQPSSNDDD